MLELLKLLSVGTFSTRHISLLSKVFSLLDSREQAVMDKCKHTEWRIPE